MPEQHVTVATFADPTEADLVKEFLETEGIQVLVSGELTAAVYAGFGDMVGGVQLQVPEDQAERAREILTAHKEELINRKQASGVPVTAAGRSAWKCPQCGTVVDRQIELCPSCGTIMPSGQATSALVPGPFESAEGQEAEEDEAASPTEIGDMLAHRAFLAAVFGMFTCPLLLHLYSLWLLWKLSGFEGGVSSTGRWKAYLAVGIDAAVLLAAAWVLKRIFLG
jgi:hypothetical protein